MHSSTFIGLLLSASHTAFSAASLLKQGGFLETQGQKGVGHNDLFYPNPEHPIPYKIPFAWDERLHYYEKQINGSGGGYYRRSSCPAINTLANRGYINRSGRNIHYDELSQAVRIVWNFGDDNVRHTSPGE